ncbi:MAG TPA: hypothetical protein VFN61_06840 [Acidimicrobiales bacterium]|nr:hypothetical protein [Acidimicrobiales bacterium]
MNTKLYAAISAGAAMAALLGGAQAASAAPAPAVSLSFSTTTPDLGTVTAKLCARNAPAGSTVYLQQRLALNKWAAVFRAGSKVKGNECVALGVTEKTQGAVEYRANLWWKGQLRFITPPEGITVYGAVPFMTWCQYINGCQSINGRSGLVEVNGHIDNYIDWICGSTPRSTSPNGKGTLPDRCQNVGAYEFPQSYTLGSPNSCRSLTMTMAAVAQDNGATGGMVTVQVLQHTDDLQTAQPKYNQISTYTFQLDGGPVAIDFSNTGPLSLYILSASADCSTSSGAPGTSSAGS